MGLDSSQRLAPFLGEMCTECARNVHADSATTIGPMSDDNDDDPVVAAAAANAAITEWIRREIERAAVTPVRVKPSPAVVRAELDGRLASIGYESSIGRKS